MNAWWVSVMEHHSDKSQDSTSQTCARMGDVVPRRHGSAPTSGMAPAGSTKPAISVGASRGAS